MNRMVLMAKGEADDVVEGMDEVSSVTSISGSSGQVVWSPSKPSRGEKRRLGVMSDAEVFAEEKRREVTSGVRASPRKTKRVTVGRFPGLQRLFYTFPRPDASSVTKLKLELVHEDPNIYVCPNFLSAAELAHIEGKVLKPSQGGSKLAKASPRKQAKRFTKSYTDDSGLSTHKDDSNRTSTFTYFTKMEDGKIAAIESRAAALVGSTIERVEPLQVVRYDVGQYFGAHHDTGVLFDDGSVEFPKNPPRRVCTLFVYLNDVDANAGGSTRFPLLKDRDGNVLEVQPVKGSAVIWSNINGDGDIEERTVHEGVAITKGEKLGMNIWITD